jgi:hypothetical protein
MRLALLTAFAASLALGQSPCPQSVLERYLQANAVHPSVEREGSVEVEIEASLPRLQKHGTMRGLKVITRAGQTLYTGLRFSGDKLIGKDVIARYLAADIERRSDRAEFAIASGNYRFQPTGQTDYNGRVAQVFRVIPKRKRAGLFRGELWLDQATALPLREWGDFVKSPSRFLSQPRFVRDYNLAENQSRPRRLILTAHASFVGDVLMTIWFSDGAGRDETRDSLSDAESDLEPVAASNP